jgi:hypothetical protein
MSNSIPFQFPPYLPAKKTHDRRRVVDCVCSSAAPATRARRRTRQVDDRERVRGAHCARIRQRQSAASPEHRRRQRPLHGADAGSGRRCRTRQSVRYGSRQVCEQRLADQECASKGQSRREQGAAQRFGLVRHGVVDRRRARPQRHAGARRAPHRRSVAALQGRAPRCAGARASFSWAL